MKNLNINCKVIYILLISLFYINTPLIAETILKFQVKANAIFSDDKFKADLKLFEKEMKSKGTNVKVDMNIFVGSNSNYFTKQLLKLKSGDDVPDLLWTETGAAIAWMRADFLHPLNNYMNSFKNWDNVYYAFKENMSYDGKIYQMPFQTTVCILYYRKDLFKKAGLDTNWNPKSWDELISTLEIIKKKLPNVTPLLEHGGKADGGQATFSGFNLILHAAGGQMMDDNQEKWIVTSKEILDTFKFYEDVTKKKLVNPRRAIGKEAYNWTNKAFSDAKGAVIIMGAWGFTSLWGPGKKLEIPNIYENVGYTKVPSKTPGSSTRGQDFVAASGGWNLGIPKKSKNKDLAWELMKFLSDSTRHSKYMTLVSQVGPRSDIAKNPLTKQNKFISDITAWLPYTYIKPLTYMEWATNRKKISEGIGNIMIGKWTSMKAMKEYAKFMENKYGKNKVIYKF